MSTGILLMTYGSAVTAEDVPAYLSSVRGGKDAEPELVEEFKRRYNLISRSPLIEITHAQARSLQRYMDRHFGEGSFTVDMGMLHSKPQIESAITRFSTAGIKKVIGIVLAPQYSEIIMGGYKRAVDAAVASLEKPIEVKVCGPWYETPNFINALAVTISDALYKHPGIPVIFTAHSLPKSVIDRDPAYIDQLHQTIDAVATKLKLTNDRWQFAYQSAGHTPEEWLKPDFKDLLPALQKAGHDQVLIAPLQFLSDHLEILYDIDIAAAEQAEVCGLKLRRTRMLNDEPMLIRTLAEVATKTSVTLPK